MSGTSVYFLLLFIFYLISGELIQSKSGRNPLKPQRLAFSTESSVVSIPPILILLVAPGSNPFLKGKKVVKKKTIECRGKRKIDSLSVKWAFQRSRRRAVDA